MRLFGSRSLFWFLAAYAIVLCVLLPVLSLWLDEVMTLTAAYKPTMGAMLDYIRLFAGATPLTVLPARWTSQLLGQSAFTARLPSAVASLVACPAVFLLARRMQLKMPVLAVAAFSVFPLQLRYALEARPYALALSLTVWATEVYLRWQDRPGQRSLVWMYAVLIALAVLAQPYAIFVAVAHLFWYAYSQRRMPTAPLCGILLALGLLSPWYLYYHDAWTAQMAEENLTTWNWKSVLVLLRELSGSGYAGTALLGAVLVFGVRALSVPRRFWLCLGLTPLLILPIANLAFGYFFAIRQVIYIVPVLALLVASAAGFPGRWGKVLVAASLGASLIGDWNWFHKPREDWRAAADAISVELALGGCVVFAGDSTPLYLLFHPELETRQCRTASDRVVVGTIPYGAPSYDAAVAPLFARGLTKRSEQPFDGPRVEVFTK